MVVEPCQKVLRASIARAVDMAPLQHELTEERFVQRSPISDGVKKVMLFKS